MFNVLVIAVLILINGLFAMSEMAVVSSRKPKLQKLADDGNRRAANALLLAQDPNRFLSTVQVGITLVGVGSGAFGAASLAGPLSASLDRIGVPDAVSYPVSFGVLIVLITYASLVIGELVPKRLALNDPEGIAMSVAGLMSRVSRVATPLVKLLSVSTEGLLRLLGAKKSDDPPVSEEEINSLLQQGTDAGVFEASEQAIVENLFWLGDQYVSSIMTPRRDIGWVEVESDAATLKANLEAYSYSRILVCHENLDHIIGMVHTRDLLKGCMEGETLDLAAASKKPLFVPETLPVLKLLEQYRESGTHVAVVVNEYGHTEGLITLNDVLEGLVGDLPEPNELSSPYLTLRDDGSYLLDGLLEVDDLKELMGVRTLPREDDSDFRTLGGFVIAYLDRIPSAADSFEAEGWRFEVMDMDGSRVDKLLVFKAPEVAEEPATASSEG